MKLRLFCDACLMLAIGLSACIARGQNSIVPPEPARAMEIEVESMSVAIGRHQAGHPMFGDETDSGRLETPATSVMLLTDFEQASLANHPSLGAISAQVNAAQWRYQKAGLLPDTRVGYVGDEMGTEGTAGFQGGYLSQQIVTGKKLQLDQAVIANEVAALQQQRAAMQQRVITDVRMAFFAVLVAQERIKLEQQLVEVAESSESTLKSLYESGEGRRTDYLQARIELDKQLMSLQTSRQSHAAAWRQLTTVSGMLDLPPTRVDGNLFEIMPRLDWNAVRASLLASSPEVARVIAQIQREQSSLVRACAERYPDLTAQVGYVTDNSTGEELVNVQASIPLPRKRRVRAEVGEARSRLMRARQQLDVIERQLTQQLAQEFRNYEQSRDRIERYRDHILPRAKESRELVSQAYNMGELSYVDSLISQRTYFQSQVGYLDEIGRYWNSYQRIDGLLLDGALDQNVGL